MKRSERFQKKRNSSRTTGTNDLCNKCGKPGYFIKYYPLHKMFIKNT